MSLDELLHTERDLRQQNAAVDKHVVSLKGRVEKLRLKQETLENQKRKVGEAKSWETRQKESHIKELQRAKAEMEAKRQQIILLTRHAEKLRARIHEMQDKYKSLNQKRLQLQEKYLHPSLRELVVTEAARGGPISEHLVNKTMDEIIPEIENGLRGLHRVENQLHHASPIAGVFTLFCIYALAVSLVVTCVRYITIAQRIMTLRRMLFMADMSTLVIWFLICVCYAAILTDPLEAMAREHGSVTMVVQILIMAGLIGNVVLKCLALCSNVGTQGFTELVVVVFVAQHYYQAVWVPIVLDEGVNANLWSYLGYASINGSLAVYRARSLSGAMQTAQAEFCGATAGKWENSWLKTRIEKGLQYLEDLFTLGIPSEDTDVEYMSEENTNTPRTRRTRQGRKELIQMGYTPFSKPRDPRA
eukprot:TRINITY_DN1299_c0_g1_i2.p1 TRINITY_DN1299_c0_g1~~TRINITY_DN1299_c0_g1_i2.p1  ORF type:complete len:417 (+),score=53.85 TRINITY_DN1299_c0_g1_i2:757-2007(+)